MSSEASVPGKVIGLIVIALILRAVVKFVINHLVSIIGNLAKLNERAVGVVMIFVLLAVSKSIDGLARKLNPLGIETSAQVSFFSSSVEEVMELGIPTSLSSAPLLVQESYSVIFGSVP